MKTIKDKEYSYNHTKSRLLTRYGIEITREDYDYFCRRIQTKDCISLVNIEYQKGDNQYVYDLQFPRRGDIRIVWSEKRQLITTVLERE